MEGPGGLLSTGLHRVGHDWSDLAAAVADHGWRSLVGCSLCGREESDTTEQLHFHFSLSCSGEGNGNPLQYSCLENPRNGGAWWAAVYGVAQSRTWLKRLSSSSSSRPSYPDERSSKDININCVFLTLRVDKVFLNHKRIFFHSTLIPKTERNMSEI